MAESVRMYEPLQGRLPPGARFTVDRGRVVILFTCQTAELFGVGTDYRSANLYHVRDSELDSERIMMDLFGDPDQGHRRLTFDEHTKRTKLYITEFLKQFEISFREHCRYPVWLTGSHLYVDLNDAAPS